MAFNFTLDSEPFPVDEPFDGGQLLTGSELRLGPCGDRAGDRVLGSILECTDKPQRLMPVGHLMLAPDSVRRFPSGNRHADQLHLTGGDGAGFVEQDRVDPAGRLQHLGPLDQQAEFRAAAGADQQRKWCGQAQRTGAGDDQDRDSCADGKGRAAAFDQPEGECEQREYEHDRHEHRGDPVGQLLHRCLAGLGLLDQPGDLGQGGVRADPGRLDHQSATGVDAGTDHFVTGVLLDRHGLPGQQGLVDCRGALDHDAVGRDLLTGADHEALTDAEPVDRNHGLGSVRPEQRHLLGAHVQQLPEGVAGPGLRPLLEVATGQQEGGDHAGDLEVEVVEAAASSRDELELHGHAGLAGHAEEHRVEAEEVGRQGAERDQRVHGRATVLRGLPGGAVEGQPAPEDDRRRQRQRHPLPVVELQRRDHRDQHQGYGQDAADHEAPEKVGRRRDRVAHVVVGIRGVVLPGQAGI